MLKDTIYKSHNSSRFLKKMMFIKNLFLKSYASLVLENTRNYIMMISESPISMHSIDSETPVLFLQGLQIKLSTWKPMSGLDSGGVAVVQLLSRVWLFVTPWTTVLHSFPVLQYPPEFAQTYVHWVGDTIQPSHPLSLSFPLALNLSQNQGLYQWVGSSHQFFGAQLSLWSNTHIHTWLLEKP